MVSLKKLVTFVSNGNMDQAKTGSRPRYSTGNRRFHRPFHVPRGDNFLYKHHQPLHPPKPPFHSLSSAPMLAYVRYNKAKFWYDVTKEWFRASVTPGRTRISTFFVNF